MPAKWCTYRRNRDEGYKAVLENTLLGHRRKNMERIMAIALIVLLSSTCFADDKKQHKLQMSLADTFVVAETDEWKVDVQKVLTLRFANVNITPKKGKSFDMQLYFKCDTPDLAQFDSSDKIKKSIMSSSKKYLPYSVEKKVELKKLNVKGWYGWYIVLTDAELATKSKIPDGEFKYMVRGMVRLSRDSALGFSFMTNELDTPGYKKLFDYILSFIKEKKGSNKPDASNGIAMSAKLSASSYAVGKDIRITVTIKNNRQNSIVIKEGHLLARFLVNGIEKTFLQSVRASYKQGVKLITVKPGAEYREDFTVHPKTELKPGRYPIRVRYVDNDPSSTCGDLSAGEIMVRIR
jgi:hypothetical protein